MIWERGPPLNAEDSVWIAQLITPSRSRNSRPAFRGLGPLRVVLKKPFAEDLKRFAFALLAEVLLEWCNELIECSHRIVPWWELIKCRSTRQNLQGWLLWKVCWQAVQTTSVTNARLGTLDRLSAPLRGCVAVMTTTVINSRLIAYNDA